MRASRRRRRRPPTAWHVVELGHAIGPWSPEQLAQAIGAGRVGPDTLVWCPGMESWVAARSVPALARVRGSASAAAVVGLVRLAAACGANAAYRRIRLNDRGGSPSPPVALELRHQREQLERAGRRRAIAELAVERGHVHGDPLGVAPRRSSRRARSRARPRSRESPASKQRCASDSR